MKLIDKLKNCEGCKHRRSFLKGMLMTVAGMLMLPRRTQATDCRFLTCPNGEQAALCCDTGCTNCVITEGGQCITLRETCSGESTIYGVCCPQCPPHCPNVSETESKQPWWEITFDNKSIIYVTSSDPNVDPLDKWRRGVATLRDKDKNLRVAVSARKL